MKLTVDVAKAPVGPGGRPIEDYDPIVLEFSDAADLRTALARILGFADKNGIPEEGLRLTIERS